MERNIFSNIGYDYGIKPFFIIAGDTEFSEQFSKAEGTGLLYGWTKTKENKGSPIQLLFLFKNEKPAEIFFNILLNWVEKSNNDGDAVNLDFIENNEGRYVICISPDIYKLTDNIIPPHLKERVNPIVIILTHFKQMDSLSENYLTFKERYKESEKIEIGYAIGEMNKIEKVSKKKFFKKKFNFFKENEIPSNNTAWTYKLRNESSNFGAKNQSKLPKDSIEEISKRRISEMKTLLPLTYSKLNNLWLGEIQKKISQTHDPELVKQAICNLTVFERLKKFDTFSPDFFKEGYPIRILEYLLATYESFDTYYPPDSFYKEELIISQIGNDKKELENFLNK